MTTLQLSVEY